MCFRSERGLASASEAFFGRRWVGVFGRVRFYAVRSHVRDARMHANLCEVARFADRMLGERRPSAVVRARPASAC